MATRKQAIDFLRYQPYKLGHLVGFTKLQTLHNDWMVDMINGKGDVTLQAHRGSYKTTCVSIALSVILILWRNDRVMFMRKTDTDVKEIISQTAKILESPQMQAFSQLIYGHGFKLSTRSASEISTSLSKDIKGAAQLIGIGMGSSLTGKHFDRIFTDDIVNVQDRVSKAERERTKTIYQELQNIKNRGGRIYNTGTPWHKDDAFSLMPNPKRYDCYSTGLIDSEELAKIKGSMTGSLFAANYELRHIAAEDVIFADPKTGADQAMVDQGECHVDAAYDGEDFTAFTICRKRLAEIGKDDKGVSIHDHLYFVYGRIWRKHVDDCEAEIIAMRKKFNAGRIYCETNGDKGYLAKDLKRRGERVVPYHEDMNKYLKITSYLKAEWRKVVFVDGTDPEYIDQVCEYNENAEHDDAPDSLASIIRKLWKKDGNDNAYHPILG